MSGRSGPAWPEVLASALVGTARTGEDADALLDAAAAHALRRRAGMALVPSARTPDTEPAPSPEATDPARRAGTAPPVTHPDTEPPPSPDKGPAPNPDTGPTPNPHTGPPPSPHGTDPTPHPDPAPVDQLPRVGTAAAARADDLLALDSWPRDARPLRDIASRLEVLGEWLAAAAAAHKRLPPELVPALLDAGRRHRGVRPWLEPVAGPLAAWLANQRADWAYAATERQRETASHEWELGSIGSRVAYLAQLRHDDPARARELLARAWDDETPDDRAALLTALRESPTPKDEPILERALDDRRRQVREAALDLLAVLPDSGHGRRMAARARECVDLTGTGPIQVTPPAECDRAMRRDGVSPRAPAGMGERAWWLEEILARTPLSVWPGPDMTSRLPEKWVATLQRGLARAAATQRDGAWAAALVDQLIADVEVHKRLDDRLLLEALYDALPPDDLAARATAALAKPAAVGVEHMLELCPRPWPPAVADAVLAALAEQLSHRGAGWRVASLCELAALRLPADLHPRAVALLDRLRAIRANDPAIAAVERFAATLKYRHDMLEELA